MPAVPALGLDPGLLSLSMRPVEAATLIIIPTLATNAWQLMSGPDPAAVTLRFALLLVGVVLGTALGVGFLTGSRTTLVSLTLGGVLILYAVVGLLSTRLHVSTEAERWLSPAIGFAMSVGNLCRPKPLLWHTPRPAPRCSDDTCIARRIADPGCRPVPTT
jgi:hypothetical protein